MKSASKSSHRPKVILDSFIPVVPDRLSLDDRPSAMSSVIAFRTGSTLPASTSCSSSESSEGWCSSPRGSSPLRESTPGVSDEDALEPLSGGGSRSSQVMETTGAEEAEEAEEAARAWLRVRAPGLRFPASAPTTIVGIWGSGGGGGRGGEERFTGGTDETGEFPFGDPLLLCILLEDVREFFLWLVVLADRH